MNSLKIFFMFLPIVFICSVNVYSSNIMNKTFHSFDSEYILCESDADIEDQSEIYQEPAEQEGEDTPAEIYNQPEDAQDESEVNNDTLENTEAD